MGQREHTAYLKLREAQDKAKRSPHFSDFKEKALKAEIEYLKEKAIDDAEERQARIDARNGDWE